MVWRERPKSRPISFKPIINGSGVAPMSCGSMLISSLTVLRLNKTPPPLLAVTGSVIPMTQQLPTSQQLWYYNTALRVWRQGEVWASYSNLDTTRM